jgi:hypothetical protein
MYSRVARKREAKMPKGRLRRGFLTSSAAVATASKPIKAKKIMAAP